MSVCLDTAGTALRTPVTMQRTTHQPDQPRARISHIKRPTKIALRLREEQRIWSSLWR